MISGAMSESLTQEKLRQDQDLDRGLDQGLEQERDLEPAREARRPFDASDLDKLPRVRSDDPPYQNWWVIDARTDRIIL